MIQLLTPTHWKDYELIDCGDFEKLERFGNVILIRPEPQAVWSKALPEAEWQKLHHIKFKGRWRMAEKEPQNSRPLAY
jgi:23S rRNA (cytosine1962-C5)-methyltransferase